MLHGHISSTAADVPLWDMLGGPQGNKSAEIGGTPSSGAGGNRTPVRQVVGTPATTIPDSATYSRGTGGSADRPYERTFSTAGSFPDVSGLCRLSAVFPCGPPSLLLPGCEDQAPCAISGHDDSSTD